MVVEGLLKNELFQGSAQHLTRRCLFRCAKRQAREQQMLEAALKLFGAGCIAQLLKVR